jgi:hypothetical protein
MGREFSIAIEATRLRRSNRKVYAAVEIRLPPAEGDAAPPLIRAAQADIELPSLLTFEQFTYESFVGTLGRNPDEAEQDAWVAALEAAFAIDTAAVIAAASSLVRALFEGAEFTALDTTDSEFVSRLYGGYLGRPPEVGGKGFWLDVLAGTDRDHLLDSFDASSEFARRAGEIGALLRYEPILREPSAPALSDGNASDNFDFRLVNLDDRFSSYLGNSARLLYPASVVVLRAYPVGEGEDYEGDVLFEGFATFNLISKQTADLTVVSDISGRNLSVGDVDTQRCKLIYKGRGCDTNDPSPTCSRIWEDATNGCASKDPAPVLIGAANNQPSFGGGPDKAVEAAGGEDSDVGPTQAPDPWPGSGYTDPEDPRLQPSRRGPSTRTAVDIN